MIEEKHANTPLADHVRPIYHTDGTHILNAREDENVLEAVCQGDAAIGHQLHRHRATHLVFHRCRYLHPDEGQHRESMDATLGGWLHHSRNHAIGVFEQYYVSDIGWQSWFEHRF